MKKLRVSPGLSEDGLGDVCVDGGTAAGGGSLSTTARDASSVELDAPSDNSSVKKLKPFRYITQTVSQSSRLVAFSVQHTSYFY